MSDRDVHVLPLFDGEPVHTRNVTCWCRPRTERGDECLLVVHRCLTRPEENTVTDRVEVS